MKNSVVYSSEHSSLKYTQNYGKLNYSKFTWLSGEYDPDNNYPTDHVGIEYMKSFQNLGSNGVWFLMAYEHKDYANKIDFTYFIDNYGNTWLQKKQNGKVTIPIKLKPYNTRRMRDDEIMRFHERFYPVIENNTVSLNEFLSQYNQEKAIIDAGFDLIETTPVNNYALKAELKNRQIIKSNLHGLLVDNCGNIYEKLNTNFVIPFIKECSPIFEALLSRSSHSAGFLDGVFGENVRSIINPAILLLVELNKSIIFDSKLKFEHCPAVEVPQSIAKQIKGKYIIHERSWMSGGKFFIDNYGYCYTQGSFTMPGGGFDGFVRWIITDDKIIPIKSTFEDHSPLPLALKPILDFLFKACDRADRGGGWGSGRSGENQNLATWIHSLQPFVKWFFANYGNNASRAENVAHLQTKKEERDHLITIEEATRAAEREIERIRKEEERQEVIRKREAEKEQEKTKIQRDYDVWLEKHNAEMKRQAEQLRQAMSDAEATADFKRIEYLKMMERLDKE